MKNFWKRKIKTTITYFINTIHNGRLFERDD